jgi:iron complex outermembrane receptor protein
MMFTRQRMMVAVVAAVAAAEVGAQATLEEVVVTARMRSESLAESPVSVKAFTESDIRSSGIQTPQDFVDLTPNVTLVQTQSTGNSFLNIRGISSARNSELAAAVVIDGVLLSNPSQLNQQLFDIEQVEVLRGPQGAIYGRNAIGGAITITTKAPGDEHEGEIRIGAESAPGWSVKGYVGGPLSDDGSVKYRLAGSYMDNDGYIDNAYLGEEADPYKDTSMRARLNWDVSDRLSTDFRVSYSKLETQAFYFIIDVEADDTDNPVQVNNPGYNEREFLSASFKFDYDLGFATLSGVTAYDDLEETSSGDQFNFLPREHPYNYFNNDAFGGFIKFLTGDEYTDLSQNQYLEVESVSQEIRLTGNNESGPQWIAGAYFIATDRYISTGSQIDRGLGVFNVQKDFRDSVFVNPADPSPQLGILADEQDNFAWAVFGQVAFDITDDLELSLAARYDHDERENTALTPPLYDTTGLGIVYGEKRKESWDAFQPKATLRWRPNDNWVVYGDISRGFRSGGFNQTGVGTAILYPGIDDIFDEQISTNFEVGAKGDLLDGRLRLSAALFYNELEGAYFFFYDPNTNTQNLGSVPEAEYTGVELEGTALLGEYFTLNFGLGLTDSEITEAPTADWLGNQAPLVSEVTGNVGLQFRAPVGAGDMEFFARADWQHLGETWWEPNNYSSRSAVDLVDLRAGLESADNWAVTVWVKNATDEEYNTEYSPGPDAAFILGIPGVKPQFNFLWPAQGVRYGIELTKWF